MYSEVVLDFKQVQAIVELLERIRLPNDEEEPVEIELPKDVLANFYFTIVSICHQTSPIAGPNLQGRVAGIQLRGWDYLRVKWLAATENDYPLVYPQSLSTISPGTIKDILRDNRGRSTISDAKGRAVLLNNLGDHMLKLKYNSVQEMYDKFEGFLIRENEQGLLQQLSEFIAYADPVKKKSLFFLSLMKNHALWIYKDDYNLGPSVDYHEIRGHLRFGSVRIKDEKLLRKISMNISITQEEDIAIRTAVYDAIMYISEKSTISSSVLHYFFWNIFRNCCDRVNPHCYFCPPNCQLPSRYADLKRQINTRRCIFADQCLSANSKNKLTEPAVVTEYY